MLKQTLAMGACLLILVLGSCANAGDDQKGFKEESKYTNTIYVPIADEVIDRMFEMGKVTKKDVIYHVGCGDGRVLFKAAKKYGAHGVGIDIRPERINEAVDLAKKYEVGTLVEIRFGDWLKVNDLGDATVVVMYMLPEFLDLWFPIAKEKLKPGTRILTHDYRPLKGWEPTKVEMVKSATREHRVYMWIVPEK